MTSDDTTLADRVRGALATEPSTREVAMFGGLSFMVDDEMVVAVRGNGDLLVRIDPQRSDELLTRPGAAPAEMGAGRAMGPGWLDVTADVLATDDDVASWVGVALERPRPGGAGSR